jgi:hypothetical protein
MKKWGLTLVLIASLMVSMGCATVGRIVEGSREPAGTPIEEQPAANPVGIQPASAPLPADNLTQDKSWTSYRRAWQLSTKR